MTDTSMTPETPNVAETAHFLRRFADMMSVGHNANFLHHAAVWLETLSARLTAAQDEEQLWRYKYETIAEHTDALEAECEALKHDLDGHLNVISSTLSERDALRATLQAREAEVSELRVIWSVSAMNSPRHRSRINRPWPSLARHSSASARRSRRNSRRTATAARRPLESPAALEQRGEEIDQLRQQLAEQSKAHELELSQLRLGLAGERHDLAARLKVSGDELASLRVVSERERDALMAKVAALEAKRAELRSAFDRIADLQNQANEPRNGAGPFGMPPKQRRCRRPTQPGDRSPCRSARPTWWCRGPRCARRAPSSNISPMNSPAPETSRRR